MKSLKNIFVSVFLLSVVSLYLGHDYANYYFHFSSKIEGSASKSSQSLASAETSLEEDIPVVFQKNLILIINLWGESFTSSTCSFPPKLYYSIWLPPDIS